MMTFTRSCHKIYCFDLDNTLFNTWPSLKNRQESKSWLAYFFSENKRILSLKSFAQMKELISARLNRNNTEVLFLSARHWSLWPVTYLQLILLFGFLHPRRIILVPTAAKKPNKLNVIWLRYNCKITWVDDLSFGHETGVVQFYHDEIAFAKNREWLTLIGTDKILLLTKEA